MTDLETERPAQHDFGFDHRSPDYVLDQNAIEADLRSHCPAWTSNHRGYWTLASHDGITSALRNKELTSAEKVFDDEGNVTGGLSIPGQSVFTMVPLETDPPAWEGYRKLLNPVFAPPAVRARRPRIQEFATEVVNNVIELGSADMILDVATGVTAMSTLDILKLPLEDWEFYAGPFHKFSTTHGSDPKVMADIESVIRRIQETITARRESPEDGLFDEMIAAEINGKHMTDKELIDVIYLLLVGGFDTTAALIGHAFWYLDEHRDVHERLLTDDDFLTTATEEFIRHSSPVSNMGRTAKCPIDLGDKTIQPGDRILVMYRAANHDPQYFANPDEIDLTRFPNRHLGFGSGIHRCLGSNLARAVFQIVLREILSRMPDFRIDRENSHQFPMKPALNGWSDMPFSFTPGERLPSSLDLSHVLGVNAKH